MKMALLSLAFANSGRVPERFTGDGPDLSPPLKWEGVPAGARAFALIMDDPDAPVGTWVHWVVYDLPDDARGLAEGIGKGAALPAGAKEGKNSWGRNGYGGPSPPPGKPHRYFFKLFALSAPTGLKAGASKEELLKAMEGKTLADAQLLGTYGR